MKRCPDCQKELKHSQEYCPYCSANLFEHRKRPLKKRFLAAINKFLFGAEDELI